LILELPFEGVYCGDYSLLQYMDPAGHLHLVTPGNKYEEHGEYNDEADRLLVDIELC